MQAFWRMPVPARLLSPPVGARSHYLRLVSNRRALTSENTNRTLRRRITDTRPSFVPQRDSEFDLIQAEIDRAEGMSRWFKPSLTEHAAFSRTARQGFPR